MLLCHFVPSFAIQPITRETNAIWPWLDCYARERYNEWNAPAVWQNEITKERETEKHTAQTITFNGFCLFVCVCEVCLQSCKNCVHSAWVGTNMSFVVTPDIYMRWTSIAQRWSGSSKLIVKSSSTTCNGQSEPILLFVHIYDSIDQKELDWWKR